MLNLTDLPIHSCKPSEVTIDPNRQRTSFDKAKIKELGESMLKDGQLQPGLCRRDSDGELHVIFGERRLRAALLFDLPYHYVLSGEVNALTLARWEFHENMNRERLPWFDEVAARARLHELEEKHFKPAPGKSTYKQSDTATIAGVSPSMLSKDIALAHFAKDLPEVRNAKTKKEALKIVERIKSNVDRKDALMEQLEKANAAEKEALAKAGINKPLPQSFDEKLAAATEAAILRYDEHCLLGDMSERLANFPDEHFAICIWDPMWGVDYQSYSAQTKEIPDDFTTFIDSFPAMLEQVYAKMAQDSHLYLIYGITWNEFVFAQLERVGFTVNWMPLLWHKQGAHRTRNPTVWPGRSYEAIAYARKGSKDLAQLGAPDIITTPQPTRRIKQDHPFAKHPDLYIELLRRSAYPGDIVLDPMAGSGMLGVAAEHLHSSLSLEWWLIERDPVFRDLQLMNLQRGYADLLNAPPSELDFTKLIVGTPEWKTYWTEHPEERPAMSEWAEKK